MARLTNEQIRNMSINEADVYTDAHPAEAWAIRQSSRCYRYRTNKESGKTWLRDQGSLCRT